jgi:hypothetical protein
MRYKLTRPQRFVEIFLPKTLPYRKNVYISHARGGSVCPSLLTVSHMQYMTKYCDGEKNRSRELAGFTCFQPP